MAEPEVPLIDVTGAGYFGVPQPPPGTPFPADPRADPWLAWRVALYQARRGTFDNVPRVLDLYDPAGDYRFNFQCILLVGDAGPDRCFDRLIAELNEPAEPLDYEVGIHFSQGLAGRGRLADVPLLARTYQRHAFFEDAEVIPVFISNLIERVPGPLSDPRLFEGPDEYVAAVDARCRELTGALGGDQGLVLAGERFGVRRLGELIIDRLQAPYFPPDYRRRFEASTGIDCGTFFRNGQVQPLAAAAIVEAFLEGEAATKYEPGVRYFFSHRIPK
jgi:hypothetical protein